MNIIQYVKARKKLKCQLPERVKEGEYHRQLGRILSENRDARGKMEVEKPELLLPPSAIQDFIF